MTQRHLATVGADDDSRLVAAMLDLLDAEDRGEPLDWAGCLDGCDAAVQAEMKQVRAGLDLLQIGRAARHDPHEPPLTLPDFDRYAELNYQAKGGMKTIYGATDTRLGRRVALAIMHPHLARSERAVEWFLEEAQVASQLQHPNIAPVYDMGAMPGELSRPYFSMKLIVGRTLADVIGDYRRAPSDVGREALLRNMTAICGALEYAHLQGVFHRDLKPANVMVGQHGETQVMDWGLSKRQSRHAGKADGDEAHEDGADEETLAYGPHANVSSTARGTPAYMPPEQAKGAHVGAASDVFALGAILCEMFTAAPPYRGNSASEVFRKARAAELDDAWRRLDGCQEPAELIDLTRRCLSAEIAARPASAAAVAEEITSFMAQRERKLREAELAKAAALARVAEERKRRRLQFVYGGLLLAAITGAMLAWQSVRAANERRTQTAMHTISAALDEARVLYNAAQAAPHTTALECERAVAAWKEAVAAVEQAGSQFDLAKIDAATTSRVRQLQEQCAAELAAASARLNEARRFDMLTSKLEAIYASTGARDILGAAASNADQDAAAAFQAAFAEAGLNLLDGDVAAGVRLLKAVPDSYRERLITYLDLWAMSPAENGSRLHAIVNHVDENTLRLRMRKAMQDGDFAGLEEMAGQLRDQREQPGLILFAAMFLHTGGHLDSAIDLLKHARSTTPRDFWTHLALGKMFADLEVPRDRDAVTCYRCAVALAPDSSYAHSCLGTSLWNLGEWKEAERSFHEALRLDPQNVPALVSLAEANLFYRGDMPAARDTAKRALALSPEHLTAQFALAVCAFYEAHPRDATTQLRAIYKRYPAGTLGKLAGSMAAVFDGRYAAALKLCVAARGDIENQRSGELAGVLDLLYILALLLNGDTPRAVDVGRAAAQRYEEGGVIQYYSKLFLAVSLCCLTNADEAEAICRQAMEMRPDDPLPRHFLLWILQQRWALPEMELVHAQYEEMAARRGGLYRFFDLRWKLVLAMMRSTENELREIDAGKVDFTSRWASAVAGAHALLIAEKDLAEQNAARALRIYQGMLDLMPEFAISLSDSAKEPIGVSYRMNAVRAAGCYLAAPPESDVTAEEAAERRAAAAAKALEWFEFEVRRLSGNLRKKRWPGYAKRAFHYCRNSPDLAPFREPFIDDISEADRAAWRKLWAEIDQLLADPPAATP